MQPHASTPPRNSGGLLASVANLASAAVAAATGRTNSFSNGSTSATAPGGAAAAAGARAGAGLGGEDRDSANNNNNNNHNNQQGGRPVLAPSASAAQDRDSANQGREGQMGGLPPHALATGAAGAGYPAKGYAGALSGGSGDGAGHGFGYASSGQHELAYPKVLEAGSVHVDMVGGQLPVRC